MDPRQSPAYLLNTEERTSGVLAGLQRIIIPLRNTSHKAAEVYTHLGIRMLVPNKNIIFYAGVLVLQLPLYP